jgi:hypothetical protein
LSALAPGANLDDEGTEPPPGYGNWVDDPVADIELTYLDHIGDTVINFLVADPTHRVVKRSSSASLVAFTDKTYKVLRNSDIANATLVLELESAPDPLSLTWDEFLLDPNRYHGHPQWDILSPKEYYGVVQQWDWDPVIGHTPTIEMRAHDWPTLVSAPTLPHIWTEFLFDPHRYRDHPQWEHLSLRCCTSPTSA